ncbi:hypothetical protein N7540_003483 [Penicillium herquei]|nr:hypothetical protein N7540_003483 [Penicillium herquei]
MYESESLNPYGISRYVFGRNSMSSVRLNYQHLWFTHLTGNDLLHKSIKEIIDFPTPQRVADVGTGTAIWPISLATSHPNWQIDGFDVSGDQYPAPGRVPANVSLHEHDTFQPYPEEYHGQYDVVNVRFMMTLLSKEKFSILLKNVMELLKPGGILQWVEPISHLAKSIGPEGVITVHTSIMADMMAHNPPDGAEWVTLNGDMVKHSGFDPVAWEQYHFEDMHRIMWTQCVLMGMEEVIQKLAQSTDEAEVIKAKGLIDLLNGFKVEVSKGACVETPWFILVARKPL